MCGRLNIIAFHASVSFLVNLEVIVDQVIVVHPADARRVLSVYYS